MQTVTTHEAKTHLSRLLAAVEKGEEIHIARGKKVVARLLPAEPAPKPPRPKVGDIKGPSFEFPDAAFAPLTEEELREWGL
jgi:antitoxin (DNA-binding transcriptional repressor) of toxin-antitoxin stability system